MKPSVVIRDAFGFYLTSELQWSNHLRDACDARYQFLSVFLVHALCDVVIVRDPESPAEKIVAIVSWGTSADVFTLKLTPTI